MTPWFLDSLSRALLVLSALAAPPALAQTHWLVDAAGTGDFTSLQVAIDTVSPGDVLLIKPANYGNVVLDKRLRLIGEPPAAPGTLVRIDSLDIQSVSSFTLAALDVRRLRAVDVSGRAEIDRCQVGGGLFWFVTPTSPGGFSAVILNEVSDLLITRCQFVSASVGPADGMHGLEVQSNSTVQLVQCQVNGANTSYDSSVVLSGYGGHGLVLTGGSRAWIAETNLVGGSGEDISFGQGCFFFGCDQTGRGGDALIVADGSIADVRGSINNELRAGLQNSGLSGPFDGQAIRCQPPFPIAQSGGAGQAFTYAGGLVTIGGVQLPCTSAQSFIAPRLTVEGNSSPGSLVLARLFGGGGPLPGLPVVLFGSFGAAKIELPGLLLTTPAFVDFNALSLQQSGFVPATDQPAVFSIQLPLNPAFAGVRFFLQGLQILGPNQIVGTNAQVLVLSF